MLVYHKWPPRVSEVTNWSRGGIGYPGPGRWYFSWNEGSKQNRALKKQPSFHEKTSSDIYLKKIHIEKLPTFVYIWGNQIFLPKHLRKKCGKNGQLSPWGPPRNGLGQVIETVHELSQGQPSAGSRLGGSEVIGCINKALFAISF